VFNYFRNDKGLNMHRSYGYLVEQHVARAILASVAGSADQACCAPERRHRWRAAREWHRFQNKLAQMGDRRQA